jgi:eukaryotic-like serine/threonine-protein kinase
MALATGTRLGHYQIAALLGAGGMGEVYRARDTRLGRDVAIKILPTSVAADPERRARFAREAQVLAALNHPHIAQVYGVEEANGVAALVMELVEGQTLDALIIRDAGIPVDEALPLARQIAEALETAHDRGIVHRDLKPANVKVTPSGTVKVLDFGLAKAIDPSGTSTELANSPTFVTGGTQLGTILGTAAYMSPEQARGKATDKRTDIWAFGCVLYEMLSGRRAFDGETITDILGAIVHKQPDLSLLPAATPPAVRALIVRCFDKDATRRLRDIGEARLALESMGSAIGGPAAPAGEFSSGRRGVRTTAVVAALAVGALAGAAATWLAIRPASTAPPSWRLNVALPPDYILASPPILSPDGGMLAYAAGPMDGTPSLYLRPLDSFEAREVEQSRGANDAFFSPDGKWLGYVAGGALRRAPVAGGSSSVVTSVAEFFGAAWTPDGVIVFSTGVGSPLWRVRAEGGASEQVTTFDKARKDYGHVWPQYVGDNRVLFTVWTGSDRLALCRVSLEDRSTACATALSSGARYLPSGHLVIEGRPDLTVVPAAADITKQSGDMQPLVPRVYRRVGQTRSFFSVSQSGTLAYVPGNPTHQKIVWLTRDGAAAVASDVNAVYGRLSLSPDGTRVAYGGAGDVSIRDLQRGTVTRMSNQGTNLGPQWAPDGRRVFFNSNRDERWAIYAASEAEEWAPRVVLKRDTSVYVRSVAPDGTLLFAEISAGHATDLMLLSPDGKITPLAATAALEERGCFSPDGGRVAYTSDAAGGDRMEVFVTPTSGGVPVQVSTQGGDYPSWSPKGDWIYYMQGTTIMGAPIDAAGRPGLPRTVVNTRLPVRYGVIPSPDGQRFLAVVLDPDALPREIRIVPNFLSDLRARVPLR